MLSRSIGAFAAHPGVDDILVVIHPDDAGLYAAASQPYAGRLRGAVPGGARRQDSVRAGLEALGAMPLLRADHDAARPFVSAELISRVIGCLVARRGAVPGLPVTDTIKWVARGQVVETSERDRLWRAQTPQGFKFETILAAHRAEEREPAHDFTDDAGIAEWFGLDVAWWKGPRPIAN